MKTFWNERYSDPISAYGKQPNNFISTKLPLLTPGKILFPAEGEGRNAVFAAQLGWNVSAFDFSEQGKNKADALAAAHKLAIEYKVSAFLEESYPPQSFDAICNVFVHFRPHLRTAMHQRLDSYLKPGGIFMMEVFSKEHLALQQKDPNVGGPPDTTMMYSTDEIKALFPNYEIIELRQEEVYLNEGQYHVGHSSVLRFIGKKITMAKN